MTVSEEEDKETETTDMTTKSEKSETKSDNTVDVESNQEENGDDK